MRPGIGLCIAALSLAASSALAADRPPRFWNLTARTIVDFRLSPAGAGAFGMNQCVNDKDGEVDNDERLRVTGVEPGLYDARLRDKSGRTCLAKGLKIEVGGIFSIEEKDLSDCDR